MKNSFTQSMAWLHTWAGLFFGWVLFAIFIGGTLSVFDKEITHWMQPELAEAGPLTDEGLEGTIAFLTRIAPDAPTWQFTLPGPRDPAIRTTIRTGKERGAGNEIVATLDPSTGREIKSRETTGGNFFFTFHYSLYAGNVIGIWLVGAAGMAMLTMLVTGVITHRRFFKDFFTFRPSSSSQRAWLDAHNVTGVLVLPFYFMIAFTGLVIFYATFMPSGLYALYAKEPSAYFTEVLHFNRPPPPAEEKATLTSILPLFHQAKKEFGDDGSVWFVQIANPGRTNAQIGLVQRDGIRLALTRDRLVFDGVTGALRDRVISDKPDVPFVYKVMSGLHFAQFGGYTVRWLYFVCGLAGSAMIATGLVLFTVKRRKKQGAETQASPFFFRLAEALNIAIVAGLMNACLGYFWANRLLPLDLPARSGWEIKSFFFIWLACLFHALFRACIARRNYAESRMRGWVEQYAFATFLALGLPVLNALTTHDNLIAALARGDHVMAGVDLAALAGAAVFISIARHLGGRPAAPPQRRGKPSSAIAE